MHEAGNRMYNSIEGIPESEQKLYEVRKHPFGIVVVYVEAVLGLSVALGFMYFLIPQFLSDSGQSQFNSIMLAVTIGAVSLTLLLLFLASVVYHQSYMLMTDKNVTQVLQQGLFKRKVSELALGNIEDVTAEQHGIMQTLFNFGTLHVETAGEVENFEFPFCPKPNYCGKVLLEARQRYIESDPLRARLTNNRLDVPLSAQQPMPTYQMPPAPTPEQGPAAPELSPTPVTPQPPIPAPPIEPTPLPPLPPDMPPPNTPTPLTDPK